MRKVAVITCNGSGASLKYGPKDGRDGIRLTHIVDKFMREYDFPPEDYESYHFETNDSYWPSSLIRLKKAIRQAVAKGCTRFVMIGFSKGTMRIFDAVNWMQQKADQGSTTMKAVLQNTNLVLIDFQRTIFNKHNARAKVLEARTARVIYVRQEGSKANPSKRRCMNGYPMILPVGREVVIEQPGWWHNNIRHHPAVKQYILDALRWAFGQEEV